MKPISSVIISGQKKDGTVLLLTRKAISNQIKKQQQGGKDVFKFIARETLPDLEKGSRTMVFHEQTTIYIQIDKNKQLGAFAFCPQQYSEKRVIYDFLDRCITAFENKHGDSWEELKEDKDLQVGEIDQMFESYQDPSNVDLVAKAQKSVNQLKDKMHDNIKALLKRQEQIDELIDKSQDLKENSKIFLKQTKDMQGSKCCCEIF